MSEPPSESAKLEGASLRRVARLLGRCLIWFFIPLFLLVVLDPLLALLFGVNLFEVVWVVLFGWAGFLARVWPRISWNSDLVCLALACVFLIAAGSHLFLLWLTKQIIGACKVGSIRFYWPWKWTWCGLGALGLAFLIGSSVAGTVHQIGWLFTSREPWREVRGRAAFAESYALANRFQMALADHDANLRNFREHLTWRDSSSLQGYEEIRRKYHLLALVGDNGRVSGLLFFSRDADRRKHLGGMVSTREGQEHVLALELDEWLRSHQARLVAI